MAKKQTTQKQVTVTLDQFAEAVKLLGLDGTRMVITALRAGKRPQEIEPMMLPYIKRYVAMPTNERRNHRRKVGRYVARYRAMQKGGTQ
jgi:hypothetical protein